MPARQITRPVGVVTAALVLALTTGCSKSVDQGSTGAASATSAQAATALQRKTVSKLGDLAAFRRIATDVVAIVDKGDLPVAKVRIMDLEVVWNSAGAGLMLGAADDEHVHDKDIDRALKSLRDDAPSQADCKFALTALLKTFDTLQGPA